MSEKAEEEKEAALVVVGPHLTMYGAPGNSSRLFLLNFYMGVGCNPSKNISPDFVFSGQLQGVCTKEFRALGRSKAFWPKTKATSSRQIFCNHTNNFISIYLPSMPLFSTSYKHEIRRKGLFY